MILHHQIKLLFKDYRRELARIKEAMESPDDTLVIERADWIRLTLKANYKRFLAIFRATKELFWLHKSLKEEIEALEKSKKAYLKDAQRRHSALAKQKLYAFMTDDEEFEVSHAVERRQKDLVEKDKKLRATQQELIVKQEELETRIQETNLAKSSYYRLTDQEMDLFENQRGWILDGVEKHGNIAAAVRNDARITLRPSTILHYAKKHRQFGQDLEIARQVFKENLDATLIDRAMNGTVNPVFQRGEYVGDYAVKDNKLLVEVAKAKIAEQYNPKAYAQANPQGPSGTTINILSFDGVDETKRGYARNIGVVKSVDDTGRVERITQAKKMIDFYKKKGSAEIIEGEVIDAADSKEE